MCVIDELGKIDLVQDLKLKINQVYMYHKEKMFLRPLHFILYYNIEE